MRPQSIPIDHRFGLRTPLPLAVHIHVIRLFITPPPARLYITSGRTAAAQTCLDEPSEDGKSRSSPHEAKQVVSNLSAYVKFGDTADDVSEDDEHDGCDDRSDGYEEGVEEGEDSNGETEPARVDRQRDKEY